MSGLTLYELLFENLNPLFDTLDMCRTIEERAACEAEIRRIIETYLSKVDNINRYLGHLASQVEFATKEIERLKMRKAAFEHKQERLEQYVIYIMQRQNVRKLEGDTSSLTLRTNTPGVEIDDEAAVPAEFKTIIPATFQIDKRAIKKAIDAGVEVSGAHLREPSVSLIRK